MGGVEQLFSEKGVEGIRFDNEAQRFYCGFEDAQGMPFDVALSFGDGLIMPARLN